MSDPRRVYPILIEAGAVYTLDGVNLDLSPDDAAAIIAGFEAASFKGHEPVEEVIERERIPVGKKRRVG